MRGSGLYFASIGLKWYVINQIRRRKSCGEIEVVYEKDFIATCDYIESVMGLYQDYSIDLNHFYREYDEALKEAYFDGR